MESSVINIEATNAEPLALQIAERANSLTITDAETMQRSAEITSEAKARIKVLEQLRKEEKEAILAAGRSCDERWNARKRPYEQIIAEIEPQQRAYLDAERKRREAAEKAAHESAEKERLRLESIARENERKAQAAREAGDESKAERYEAKAEMQQAQAATVPVVMPEAPVKVAGISAARPWKATCTDLEALLIAAVTSPDPVMRAICRGMLKIEFSQQAGNRQAASTKNAIKVPGVVFAQETQVRGAR